MKSLILLLTCTALGSCNLATESGAWTLNDTNVLEVGDLPGGSGVFSTFVEIDVTDRHDKIYQLWLPFFGDKKPLPLEKQTCDFEGRTTRTDAHDHPVRVIAAFSCGGPTYRNDYF